jgi:hypothetical protein
MRAFRVRVTIRSRPGRLGGLASLSHRHALFTLEVSRAIGGL